MTACSQLAAIYDDPLAAARAHEESGGQVAGLLSHTVPWELVRASCLFPTLLRSRLPAPAVGDLLEANVFSPRIRSLFGSACSGDWHFVRGLFVARTSEPEYKLYLYLREVQRQGLGAGVPPIFLYDLLHSRSQESYDYGLSRTIAFKHTLETLTGRPIGAEDLEAAIAESNAARAAVRRILALRADHPRVSGTLAAALIGPFHLMPRADYTHLANRAATELQTRSPIDGARLLIKGASLDHSGLHHALESDGAVVVAEDDWWGSRSAGADIATDRTPLTAVFEKYFAGTPSPRVFPATLADEWFENNVRNGIDGVVFFLPPDDSVAGWDYPRQRALVAGLGVSSLVIRADPTEPLPPEWRARIHDFVGALPHDAASR